MFTVIIFLLDNSQTYGEDENMLNVTVTLRFGGLNKQLFSLLEFSRT